MNRPKKSYSVLTMMVLSIAVFWSVSSSSGQTYIPTVPDKTKTLPANDGGPDGCNSSRFKCMIGGDAVLDKQTGLTWARNADIPKGKLPWLEAVRFCKDLEIGNRKGWRLPTKDELIALLDTSQSVPALPEGHPFKNVQTFGRYWTSTTYEGNNDSVWVVGMNIGRVEDNLKLFDGWIWPVLGGK